MIFAVKTRAQLKWTCVRDIICTSRPRCGPCSSLFRSVHSLLIAVYLCMHLFFSTHWWFHFFRFINLCSVSSLRFASGVHRQLWTFFKCIPSLSVSCYTFAAELSGQLQNAKYTLTCDFYAHLLYLIFAVVLSVLRFERKLKAEKRVIETQRLETQCATGQLISVNFQHSPESA